MRRTVLFSLAATASLTLTAGAALADPATLPAGGQSAFSPSAETICFGGVTNNSARPTASAQAECLFDGSSVWARVAANSGAGSDAVDIAAQTTIVVGHFQVETPEGATVDGFLPVHVMVPVSWGGALANAQTEAGASADINMYLRLREADAADPTLAGELVSQTRFQGATHGGAGACASLPAGTVSAAAMVIGCAEGVVQQDAGAAVAELSGVVRTNQPYVIELVAHAAIVSTLSADAAAEDVNFFNQPDVETAPAGLSWSADASVAIGTDANELVADVRDELEDLKDEVANLEQQLAMLRWDFEGHYHTYLTGRGEGHNNTVAETPPPSLPPPMPMPAEEETGSVTAPTSTPTSTSTVSGTTSSSPSGTAKAPPQNQQTQEGGGAFGLPLLLLLSGFALLRIRTEQR